MNDIQKRFAMFLGGCITTRAGFVVLSYFLARSSKSNAAKTLKGLGYLALLPALGWIIIFSFGLRKQGRETQQAPIWWNFARPFHAMFYILFAAFVLSNDYKLVKNAYIWLLIDVVLGLTLFLWYHIKNNNLRYL